MKTIYTSTITASIAVMLAARATAIEAPEDNAPPPAVAAPTAANHPNPDAKAEAAYLGVVTSTVPEMLAVHLGLKPGEGVVVRSVMPDGPAAKAGVANHDVITRVAGTAVGSPEDLRNLVTARKPGETLHLDLIHEGKPTGADVALGTRPAELAGFEPHPLDQLNLDGVPQDLANRLRDMIEDNLGGPEAAPQFDEAMREMKRRMEEMMRGNEELPAPGIQGNVDVQQGATIRMLDQNGSIELKSNNGGKEVTIRDKDDNITWTGPWDTEQDKAAAPEEVRKRVDRLNLDTNFKGNGIRLRARPDDGNE